MLSNHIGATLGAIEVVCALPRQGVIFLVEGSGSLFGAADGGGNARGFGQRLAAPRLCERALATSAAHTQLISGTARP